MSAVFFYHNAIQVELIESGHGTSVTQSQLDRILGFSVWHPLQGLDRIKMIQRRFDIGRHTRALIEEEQARLVTDHQRLIARQDEISEVHSVL